MNLFKRKPKLMTIENISNPIAAEAVSPAKFKDRHEESALAITRALWEAGAPVTINFDFDVNKNNNPKQVGVFKVKVWTDKRHLVALKNVNRKLILQGVEKSLESNEEALRS